MYDQVDNVISGHLFATDRVVDGEGEIDQRSPVYGDATVVRRGEDRSQVGQMGDRRVVLDRGYIVVDERAVKAVRIGQQRRQYEQQPSDEHAASRRRC